MTQRYTAFLQINHRPDGKGRLTFKAEPAELVGMPMNQGWHCSPQAPDIVQYGIATDNWSRLLGATRTMMLTLGFTAAEQFPSEPGNATIELSRHHWQIDTSGF